MEEEAFRRGDVLDDLGGLLDLLRSRPSRQLVGVNLAGILLSVKAPQQSRGKDMFMSLVLTDGKPWRNGAEAYASISVLLFASAAHKFPTISRVGDIVYLQNAKVSTFEGMLQVALSLHKQNLVAVFPRSEAEGAAAGQELGRREVLPGLLADMVIGRARFVAPGNFGAGLTGLRARADEVLRSREHCKYLASNATYCKTLRDAIEAIDGETAFDARVKILDRETVGDDVLVSITDESLAPESAKLFIPEGTANMAARAILDARDGCWVRLFKVRKCSGTSQSLRLEWIKSRTLALQLSDLGPGADGGRVDIFDLVRAEAIVDSAPFVAQCLEQTVSDEMEVDRGPETTNRDPSEETNQGPAAGLGQGGAQSQETIRSVGREALDLSLVPVTGCQGVTARELMQRLHADIVPIMLTITAPARYCFEARITAVYPPMDHLATIFRDDEEREAINAVIFRAEDDTGVVEAILPFADLDRLRATDDLADFSALGLVARMLSPGVFTRLFLSVD